MDYGACRVVTLACPHIDTRLVLAGIGMPADSSVSSPTILSLVEETIEYAQKNLLKPQAMISAFSAAVTAEGNALIGAQHCGDLPASYLEGADGVALALTTLGFSLEDAIAQHQRDGDSLSAMVLDVIGSQAVMDAGAYTRAIVRNELADAGVTAGACFEPGIGDIGLPLVRTLFGLSDPSAIGMSLTDSCLMLPVKSLSELIPFGERMKVPAGCGASCAKGEHSGCPSCR